MNQRIQALVAQASYKIIETNEAPIITQEFDKELFAQLIVRECATAIVNNSKNFPASDLTWIAAMEESARVVKEHFGVEE
jgi:hypothetical protein